MVLSNSDERVLIRVLLADDHTIVRGGVSHILNEQPDIEVVAETGDGKSAVALYRQERPDVSLVDLRMPILDGVQVVEQVRREFPDAVVVVLTTFDTDDDIDRALLAGAKAYLLKDVSPSDLVVIREGVIAAALTSLMILLFLGSARSTLIVTTSIPLSILGAIGALSAIGETLNISEGTVKIHLSHLFEKLGATSRTDAVAKAAERGLIRLG